MLINKIKRILSKFRYSLRLSQLSTTEPVLSATTVNVGPLQAIAVRGTVSVSDSPQHNAPLENLPPEIRDQLLSILELEELRALVHASPVFHQQYLHRRFLLCKSLETTLRSATVDANAVYQTSLLAGFSDTRTSEKITQFLKSYQDRRSSTQYSIIADRLTEDEVVGMAGFHSSVIKPLARRYTDWALTNLAGETKNLWSHKSLNKTEETRLLRALYRFQLCCNLFGRQGVVWRPSLSEDVHLYIRALGG